MENMADRLVLSKNYRRWKMKYETEQKNGVASLHYKYVSLRNIGADTIRERISS